MKIALVGLLGLSMLKGCDLGDPQSVQPQIEEALRPYFPNVKAVVLPQQHAIVGLSCLDNVGDELVKMVPPAVASNPAMSKLKLLRMIPGSSYNLVAIGFPQGLAFYNVDTGATGTTVGDASYATWYRQQCGLGTGSGGAVTYDWIGHFTLTLDFPSGKRNRLPTIASLGVWANEGIFEQHKDSEIEIRREIMRKSWAAQNVTLVDAQLDSVEKISIRYSVPGN
jgi:hypothetical protein